LIEALLEHLKAEEGFRPYVYDDATGDPIVPGYTVKGHPTIWYGLCVERGRIPRIPDEVPRDVLKRVAEEKWRALLERVPWLAELPERTQVGLAAMAYQLGVEGVLKFRNMFQALAVGDLHAASLHALDSAWARRPPPVGTPLRARRVAALIANEVDDDD
jgi:lysozyme